MSSSFIFAKGDLFFAYPNNYNHYVSYYEIPINMEVFL